MTVSAVSRSAAHRIDHRRRLSLDDMRIVRLNAKSNGR
jgi:hypothetical protein